MSEGRRARASLEPGNRVPDFTLPDQEGKATTLHELLSERSLVLYFYPRDETPGCTAEACGFRDEYEAFVDAGAQVVGVSSDDIASHRRFAEKHRLPFRLLADRDGAVRKLFGVPRTFGILDGRVTYVIDAQGIVRHVFTSQLRSRKHVAEALRVVAELGRGSPAAERADQRSRGVVPPVAR